MRKVKGVLGGCIFIILAFLLSECKKSGKKEFVELDTDSAIAVHFNFKPGTYWIYRDSLSGRTDSFYVRNNYYAAAEEAYNIYNYHYITIAQVNLDGSNPADSANWLFNYQATRIVLTYKYGINGYGWKNQIQYDPLILYPYSYGDQLSKYDTAYVSRVDVYYPGPGALYPINVGSVNHHSDIDSALSSGAVTKMSDLFIINDSVGMVNMNISHPDHGINRNWKLLRYIMVK
jgi:hypothetical protein